MPIARGESAGGGSGVGMGSGAGGSGSGAGTGSGSGSGAGTGSGAGSGSGWGSGPGVGSGSGAGSGCGGPSEATGPSAPDGAPVRSGTGSGKGATATPGTATGPGAGTARGGFGRGWPGRPAGRRTSRALASPTAWPAGARPASPPTTPADAMHRVDRAAVAARTAIRLNECRSHRGIGLRVARYPITRSPGPARVPGRPASASRGAWVSRGTAVSPRGRSRRPASACRPHAGGRTVPRDCRFRWPSRAAGTGRAVRRPTPCG